MDTFKVDVCVTSLLASVDQPGKVKMTTEEEVEDEDDIPDFRTFKVSTEDAHFFMDDANGKSNYSLTDFLF